MPTKIFVGNVREGTSTDLILRLFQEYGKVTECDVLTGYGFVHMENKDEAMSAIQGINGMPVNGNTLHVELSTPKTQGKKRGVKDNRHVPQQTKIFVGNILQGTSSQSLRDLFQQFGTVTECDILGNYGFVHMATEDEACAAIEGLNGYSLNDSLLHVELSTSIRRNVGGRGGYRGGGHRGSGSDRGYGGGYGGRMPGMVGRRFAPYSAMDDHHPMIPGSGRMRRPIPRDPYAADPYEYESEYYAPRERHPRESADPKNNDSFARELLELYNKDPEAFDRYARNPVVKEVLQVGKGKDPNDDPYLRPSKDYYERRRMAPSSIAASRSDLYGHHSSMMAAPESRMMGVPRAGGGPRSSMLYTSFE